MKKVWLSLGYLELMNSVYFFYHRLRLIIKIIALKIVTFNKISEMLYTIENDEFICQIESIGAEIRSLKNKSTNEEFIWQIDSKVWGSSSPVLFPAIGNIKESKVILDHREYRMTKHGIIRNNEDLIFSRISDSKCSFRLDHSELTKRKYPYDFVFEVSYELAGKKLIMTYDILNNDKRDMYFSCGGHTAYSLPLEEGLQISDYVVEFPRNSPLLAETLGDSGLLSYVHRKFDLVDSCLEINETLFSEDALIFADVDFDWVRLRKKNEDKGVVIRFSGYPNLALWSKPGADYICVEPWLGLPDREDESIDIEKKATYQMLESGKSFTISIITEIEV